MYCMRCGQEVMSGQVFCEDCLAIMQQHPISPDTPVYLPPRQTASPVKKQPRKRTVSMEEQMLSLRKRLRFFVVWSLVSTALAAALLYPAVQYWISDHFEVGQNYSSITVTEPTETTPE